MFDIVSTSKKYSIISILSYCYLILEIHYVGNH